MTIQKVKDLYHSKITLKEKLELVQNSRYLILEESPYENDKNLYCVMLDNFDFPHWFDCDNFIVENDIDLSTPENVKVLLKLAKLI